MLVPFASLPWHRRVWLILGLLALAAAAGYTLAALSTPQAQACVLYGDAAAARSRLLTVLGAFSLSDSWRVTWDCLTGMNRARELALIVVDDLFAVGYGVGLGLLLSALSRATADGRHTPALAADLLRFAAACYPIAGTFDLLENQLVATLLFVPEGTLGNALVWLARLCAIPKYDLSLVAGPLTALLAGAIAVAALLRRGGRRK